MYKKFSNANYANVTFQLHYMTQMAYFIL